MGLSRLVRLPQIVLPVSEYPSGEVVNRDFWAEDDGIVSRKLDNEPVRIKESRIKESGIEKSLVRVYVVDRRVSRCRCLEVLSAIREM